MAADVTTDEIVRLYLEPWCMSLGEIGAQFGISKQAVQGRLDRAGVPRRASVDAKRHRYDQWAEQSAKDIAAALVETRDVDELAGKLGAPKAWVRRYLVERFGTATMAPYSGWRKYSDDDLLGALRSTAAVIVEHTGELEVTALLYDEHRDADAAGHDAFVARFGSWSKACDLAGVACKQRRREYQLTWDRDDIILALRDFLDDEDRGQPPTSTAYDEWRSSGRDAPHLETVRRQFGSWREALWAAMR